MLLDAAFFTHTSPNLTACHTSAPPLLPEPQPLAPANAPRLDPQQLQLLEQAFDAADFDGDGAISGNELRELLRGLGLQPTQRDVQTIMRELAAPRAGGWAPARL